VLVVFNDNRSIQACVVRSFKIIMDEQLRELAERRYGQEEFLRTLFELALEDEWFQLRHLIQHDMAKAVLADYSCRQGKGYLDSQIFYNSWEEVIDIGWQAFCTHTGIPKDKVNQRLQELGNKS
jgi:hypothetical protein